MCYLLMFIFDHEYLRSMQELLKNEMVFGNYSHISNLIQILLNVQSKLHVEMEDIDNCRLLVSIRNVIYILLL